MTFLLSLVLSLVGAQQPSAKACARMCSDWRTEAPELHIDVRSCARGCRASKRALCVTLPVGGNRRACELLPEDVGARR